MCTRLTQSVTLLPLHSPGMERFGLQAMYIKGQQLGELFPDATTGYLLVETSPNSQTEKW